MIRTCEPCRWRETGQLAEYCTHPAYRGRTPLRQATAAGQPCAAPALPLWTPPLARVIEEMGITCTCGHYGPWEAFARPEPGVFSCPACRRAWRLETVRPAQRLPSGYIMPPKLACRPIS